MTFDFDGLDVRKFRRGRIRIGAEEAAGARRLAILELCGWLEGGKASERNFSRQKNAAGKKYGLRNVVKNAEILEEFARSGKKTDGKIMLLLRVKPVRALSGITNIAVMTRPEGSCPFNCIYCPQGVEAPRSYTGYEPSARRARQNGFDPYLQTCARLEQLRISGHQAAKCEVIIQGGTFNRQPKGYREEFIVGMLDALNGKNRIENKTSDGNDAGDLAETKKENKKVSETAGKKVAGIKTKKEELTENAVEAALEENEKATHRMVGLTIETRPDCASEKEVYGLVKLGTTRIELGVQTLSDGKYILARRGHGRKEVIEATRNCKDALLKVCYHMMPGLFSTPEEDGGYFGELFSNPDFRPDMLKIYPTLVMPGTGLYDLWKKGKFEPPTEEDTTRLLMKIKKNVPDYVRIMRVERDIPSNLIGEGIRTPNIRQIVRERMRRQGEKCRCIRCREIGYKTRREGVKPDFTAVEMERKDYGASGGKEIFLSMVDKTNDALMGICRLRKPSIERFVGEIGDNCGVRELHVYGDELDLGLRKAEAAQHRGFGKTLLSEAERIAKEGYDSKKLVVISGAGARPYYYKLGYARDGAYVSKTL